MTFTIIRQAFRWGERGCLQNPSSWLNWAFMSPITILRSCLCISCIACFSRTSPTPRVCFLLSLQEYKIFFPSLVISPLPVQQTSLMPSKSNWCCSNSLNNWFNRPLLMKCASVPSSHLGDDFCNKCRIHHEKLDSTMGLVKHLHIRIYIPKIQGPASNLIRCIFSRSFCSRFVSYRDGLLAQHPNLPLSHPGLGLAMAELKAYRATYIWYPWLLTIYWGHKKLHNWSVQETEHCSIITCNP